jgi:uncharacterized protein (TIGR03382 family)
LLHRLCGVVRILIVALGLALARPAAADGLSVTFTTTPNGGPFAPRNIVAVWIEDSNGAFVKTIGRWAATRVQYLLDWIGKSGKDSDAISGATRSNHANPLTVTWDLKDRNGTAVPDGTYTIRMELADADVSTGAQNHQGTFTFVKGPTGSSQMNQANGGFISVNITFASAASCNNGVVDPGETCDGNCPATCPAATDACMPISMQGTAATCDAVCVSTQITDCIDGDGCCADGCTPANDSDCAAEPPSRDVSGGCAATPSAGGMLVLVAAMLILGRRRRR